MASRRVEHLDLSLRLPPHLLELTQQWIEQFTEEGEEIVTPPKIRKDVLRINSQDLIQFFGYVDPEKLTSLDLQRLKSLAKEQLELGLNKSLHADYRYHYQWCLAALENFEFGRFNHNQSKAVGGS